MATTYLRAESAPVILPHNFAQAAAVLAQFDRATIASTIEVLVNLLDVLDGDPDLEGECSEDEISRCTDLGRAVKRDGPGCPISDPDKGADDEGEETNTEDAFWLIPHTTLGQGVGCPIADPAGDFGQDGY